MEWNEEKAQKVVKKHKKRFTLRLTLKIIRVVAALFFIFAIYNMGISILYHSSDTGKQTKFYLKLAIDWTDPQLTTDLSSSTKNEITPLLTQKMALPVFRRIGTENYVAAELNINKPIITALTHVELTNRIRYFDDEKFTFNLPVNPITNQKLKGDEYTDAWEILDMTHEGHVADLAFSTEEYYSPEKLIELLSEYDLSILWMPLTMGEYETYEEHGYGTAGNIMALSVQWGLAGAREIDEKYNSGSIRTSLDEETVKESKEAMLNNMERMLNDNKKLAEQLLDTAYLEERYNYLDEHGFKVFGAVVTGPVKELLKLQELEGIHSVQLGEIENWNWIH